MSEQRNGLYARTIQPPVNGLFPADGSGQQYLSQGPLDSPTVPLSQVIDPRLATLRGSGAQAAVQQAIGRATDVALAAGPGQFEAFHGTGASPFQRFLDEFIGTGEGAQAYSWGHYVAGRPGVAKSYMPRGGPVPLDEQGTPLTGTNLARKFYEPGSIVPSYGGGYDRVLGFNEPSGQFGWSVNVRHVNPNIERARAAGIDPQTAQGWDEIQRRPELWDNSAAEVRPRSHATFPEDRQIQAAARVRGWDMGEPGHLLNVWVKPEHEEFLDWDLPFSKQEPGVQSKVDDLYKKMLGIESKQPFGVNPNNNGAQIYKDIQGFIGPNGTPEGQALAGKLIRGSLGRVWNPTYPEMASKIIDGEGGIPGMRFLDQGSRHLPEGHPDRTYNYVIYDPKNLEITHRNGQRLIPVDHDPFAEPTGTPLTP